MTALALADYVPDRSLGAKIRRRLTRWKVAKPLPVQPRETYICFTFDDFPKSAADTGAEILDEVGARGGYYACTGMAGTSGTMGELFDERDLAPLVAAGHEICAHTESHVDCARASLNDVLVDIDTNLSHLKEMGHSLPVTQFAWPYGETSASLKPAMTTKFDAVRGILPGANNKGADLMQLSAYELDASDASTARAAAAIEAAAKNPTWLFVFTHDVRQNGSPWGTTPEDLRRLVRLARDTGANLVTPSHAVQEILAKDAA
ncbi:polysaccharide deacetylase family protein [Henriciella sp. AS95]|uniref:polysaccharide deacetylase family protein n=1 Tax=Henriciella sp. AS95 TaxID=3135782 RepID=UPI00317561BD